MKIVGNCRSSTPTHRPIIKYSTKTLKIIRIPVCDVPPELKQTLMGWSKVGVYVSAGRSHRFLCPQEGRPSMVRRSCRLQNSQQAFESKRGSEGGRRRMALEQRGRAEDTPWSTECEEAEAKPAAPWSTEQAKRQEGDRGARCAKPKPRFNARATVEHGAGTAPKGRSWSTDRE
jgi:hypothetical protein